MWDIFWGDENILQLAVVMLAYIHEYTTSHWIVSLNGWIVWYMNYIAIKLLKKKLFAEAQRFSDWRLWTHSQEFCAAKFRQTLLGQWDTRKLSSKLCAQGCLADEVLQGDFGKLGLCTFAPMASTAPPPSGSEAVSWKIPKRTWLWSHILVCVLNGERERKTNIYWASTTGQPHSKASKQ